MTDRELMSMAKQASLNAYTLRRLPTVSGGVFTGDGSALRQSGQPLREL